MGEGPADRRYEPIPCSCCESSSTRGGVKMAGGRRRDHLREVRNLSPSERTLIEYTKDSWNADNLVGIRYPDTSSDRWIHFEKVPERFRPLAKQWCQFLLARFSFTHCRQRMHDLQFFLNWLLEGNPPTTTFADITAEQ